MLEGPTYGIPYRLHNKILRPDDKNCCAMAIR